MNFWFIYCRSIIQVYLDDWIKLSIVREEVEREK